MFHTKFECQARARGLKVVSSHEVLESQTFHFFWRQWDAIEFFVGNNWVLAAIVVISSIRMIQCDRVLTSIWFRSFLLPMTQWIGFDCGLAILVQFRSEAYRVAYFFPGCCRVNNYTCCWCCFVSDEAALRSEYIKDALNKIGFHGPGVCSNIDGNVLVDNSVKTLVPRMTCIEGTSAQYYVAVRWMNKVTGSYTILEHFPLYFALSSLPWH